MTTSVVKIGAFVEILVAPHKAWGAGKLISLTRTSASVQFFDVPGGPIQSPVECTPDKLRRAKIPAQTRVWRRHTSGRWQVGRLLDDEGDTVFVQFPNGETVTLDAADVQVRWNRPLVDPLPLLCAEATESPFLADPRSAFVREVARQRATAAGVTALLSSSIELVNYQFDVISRVLSDPVQRYLLADEVGLGKTIEAGVIIRQHFLDRDDARAVIVVPQRLVAQWRSELAQRFGLDTWLDDFLHVVSHDDLERLEEVIGDAELIVVDEAHHLSKWSNSTERQLFDLISKYSQLAPKLLLLSATPVLSDEEGFLRVLHLLDPVVFPLEDLAGFRRRIASRELIAEIAATLVPENLWGLLPELERLETAYSDDKVLCERIVALRVVLDTLPSEDDESFLTKLRDLRTHLLESYRLHRRMLRHRRATIPWATVGRAGAGLAPLRTAMAATCASQWDELRHMLNAHGPIPDGLAVALLSVALHSRSDLSVRHLLTEHQLLQPELLAVADAVDRTRARWRDDDTRYKVLVETVRSTLETRGVQVVVFCDRPDDAKRCTVDLQAAFDSVVQRHLPRQSGTQDDDAAPWEAFLIAPEQVRVLVCDRYSEEGVNLHGGNKCAVHFDLPAAPNRIEQRMGRLDRYGKGDKVRSIVLVDEGNENENLWTDVVVEGWQVFSRSVASLQYLIESTNRTMAREWLQQGSVALTKHLEDLDGPNGLVQQELRQIERQDALDALAEPDDSSMDDLEDCDRDWRVWRSAFRSYAFSALLFRERAERSVATTDEDRRFRVGYTHRDGDQPTLVPMTGFLRHFLQSVDVDARGGGARMPLSHRYVFARQNATSRAALADRVRLMRVGDPLITALERFSANDDRGRVFAVWRVDRSYVPHDASGADLYLRFDFLVHAAVTPLDHSGASEDLILQEALARKASRLLPPSFVRIWIDGNGRVIDEPSELLLTPYQDSWKGTRRDFNLNPKRWRALPTEVRSGWMRDWNTLCTRLRAQAETAAARHPEQIERCQAALGACEQEARAVEAQSASRQVRLTGAAHMQEVHDLDRERRLHRRLREVLSHPTLHLDVVGAYFVSAEEIDDS